MSVERKLETKLQIRILKSQKEEWKNICENRTPKMSLTDLIISSVENKLLDSDRRTILTFIEKQGNVFAKIENNINQIAKTVNTEKTINNSLLEHYNSLLREVASLKIEQNDIVKKIYSLLAK